MKKTPSHSPSDLLVKKLITPQNNVLDLRKKIQQKTAKTIELPETQLFTDITFRAENEQREALVYGEQDANFVHIPRLVTKATGKKISEKLFSLLRRAYAKQLDISEVQSSLETCNDDFERFLILCSISLYSNPVQVQRVIASLIKKGVTGTMTNIGFFYQLNFAQESTQYTAQTMCDMLLSPTVSKDLKAEMLNSFVYWGVPLPLGIDLYKIIDPLIKAGKIPEEIEEFAVRFCLDHACRKIEADVVQLDQHPPIKPVVMDYWNLNRPIVWETIIGDINQILSEVFLKEEDVVETIVTCLIQANAPLSYRTRLARMIIFECTDGRVFSKILPALEEVCGVKKCLWWWKFHCKKATPAEINEIILGMVDDDAFTLDRVNAYAAAGFEEIINHVEFNEEDRVECIRYLVRIVNDEKIKVSPEAKARFLNILERYSIKNVPTKPEKLSEVKNVRILKA